MYYTTLLTTIRVTKCESINEMLRIAFNMLAKMSAFIQLEDIRYVELIEGILVTNIDELLRYARVIKRLDDYVYVIDLVETTERAKQYLTKEYPYISPKTLPR